MRATEDAERSAARLLALGYASFVAPATMVLATQAGIPPFDYDAVVATSAKAFELLSPGSRDAILALPLFVVGAQTARAATARELAVEATAKDAAALADMLRPRLTPASRILYLAGRGRKSDLESALAADGHRLTPIEVYVAEARRAWSFGEARGVANCDAALHYSNSERRARAAARRGRGDRTKLSRAPPRLHFRGRGLAAAVERRNARPLGLEPGRRRAVRRARAGPSARVIRALDPRTQLGTRRLGRMAAAPNSGPAKAGSINSWPTMLWPTCNCKITPAIIRFF